MNATCPSCQHKFPRQDRGRLFGGNPWTPKISECPTCQAKLQWTLWPWRAQLIAGLGIILTLFRQFPNGIRGFGIAVAVVAGVVAVTQLRLREVKPE